MTADGSYYEADLANFGDYSATESLSGLTTAMETSTNYLDTIPYFIVTDDNATVRVGARSTGALTYCTNGYWFVWKASSFQVSDVTDASVLSTALAAVKEEADVILDAAEDSEEKTALQEVYNSATATGSSIAALKKAIKTYAGAMGSSDTPLDVTSVYVNNGDFSHGVALTNSNTNAVNLAPMGWTITNSGSGIYNYLSIVANNTKYDGEENFAYNNKTTGNSLYLRHAWGTATLSASQTLNGLAKGRYKVSIPARLKLAGNSDATATIKYTIGDEDYSNTVTTSWAVYEQTFDVESTDDAVTITLTLTTPTSTNGQKLFIDGVTLTAYGDPLETVKAELTTIQAEATALLSNSTYTNVVGTERTELTTQSTATADEETVSAYQSVIDAVQAAIDAFKSAVDNYDDLVTEIAKAKALGVDETTADGYAATSTTTSATALTNTQSVKVAEYNYVTNTYEYSVNLGTWTASSGTGTMTGQHWDGTSTSTYLEQSTANWSASSWTITYDQDLTLPAGNYVFKVAGRKAVGDGVTMSLVVTDADENEIGSVSDFPEGDTGLGINTSGETDYSSESTYANSNAGRGWEWRYVKFTLSADATVNIAVTATATTSHMWVSFCNPTIQTDEEANISLIAYNIALNDAKTAINSDTYTNVTGTEKTTLQAAIDADDSLDKTDADVIDAATTTLTTATSAFTAAATSYDALARAITSATTITTTAANVGTGAFQIPESAKTTLETATSTASGVQSSGTTTAETAASAAETLNTAITTYNDAELNAPTEGTTYNIINNSDNYNYKGNAVTFKSALSADLTANTTSIGYTEKPGSIYPQNVTFTPVSDVTNGYTLSYTRADGNTVYVGTGKSTGLGSNNNQIRPTTDASKAVTIQVVATTTNGVWNLYNIAASMNIGANGASDQGFYTVNNYTSFGIQEAAKNEVSLSISSANQYGTLIVPFDVEVPSGVTTYSTSSVDGTTLDLTTAETIKANTPYIVYAAADADETLSGLGAAYTDASYAGGLLTGVYTATSAPEGSYVLQNQNDVVAFYVVSSADPITVPANRAYLTVPDGGSVKAYHFGNADDSATAISTVNGLLSGEVEGIYSVNGTKQSRLQKGINVVRFTNGKTRKVIVK